MISSGRHLCALQNSSWHAFSQGSPQPFWVSLLCYFLSFFFFCSIYSHLTLCFRKCLQVSIPDIPGTWRADLMPVLQDEKQKNFVEPIKRMTFPWPWAVLFKIEAFAAWGSLICELKSIISWPLLNHKSSLPLPSSFYLKGKKENASSYKMHFPFILLHFVHRRNRFCKGLVKTHANGHLKRPLSWCEEVILVPRLE